MMKCEEASILISKRHDIKISWIEVFRLKIHKVQCNHCALFEKEIEILAVVLSQTEIKNLSEEEIEDLKNFLEQNK